MANYKIDFAELLEPFAYSIPTKLEVLNWMLKTSKGTFRIWKWNSASVEKQIFNYSAATSSFYKPSIDIFDNDKLRIYFLNAIVCDAHLSVKEWREKERVALWHQRYIPFVKKDAYMGDFRNLKDLCGLPLIKEFYQPDYPERKNPYVKNHKFCSQGNGLEFHYDFTYEQCKDSGWSAPSIIQSKGESIFAFLNRVQDHFQTHSETFSK